MKIFVFGHQKPDLDSVVAAMAFSEFRKQRGDTDVVPSIVDKPNPETKFVFEKFNQDLPQLITSETISSEDRIILVDHNEDSQRLPGINPGSIISIYDHHKVNLNLGNPIEIYVLPVGSSNTIAWTLFQQNSFVIPINIAQLMLCAILSDTVGLKSSTTTDTDKKAVESLSSITKITDLDALTVEIFKAKSNISQLTDEQVVLNDYKIFDFSGKKVFIGQIETVEQAELLNTRRLNLISALSQIKQKESADYAFLTITDILKVNSKLILSSPEDESLALKSFGGTVTEGVLDIGAKMSRKKDIAPLIEKALQN